MNTPGRLGNLFPSKKSIGGMESRFTVARRILGRMEFEAAARWASTNKPARNTNPRFENLPGTMWNSSSRASRAPVAAVDDRLVSSH